MDLNRATLLGRLTRDPEVKTTTTGKTVTSFAIATNRVWKNAQGEKQEQSEFHNCVVWGKLADVAGQYLTKGKRLYAEGRIQTRDWTGQDGVKKYRTEIVLDNFIMLDGARGGNTGGSTYKKSSDSVPPPNEPATDELKVEDIPF